MKKYIRTFLLIFLVSGCQSSVKQIKLDHRAFMLSGGGERTIQAVDAQTGKTVKVEWSSSDPEIAAVNKTGKVTGVSKGDAVIRAVVPGTGIADSCLVSVDVPFQNPILPPSWELYIADPEPKVYGNGVYVYGSKDVEGGVLPSGVSWCSDRYHVLYSEDLRHWTDKGMSFHLDQVPEEYMHPDYQRLWAPDVLRHPTNGKYYLYFCFNHTQPVREEIFMVAVSDYPEGPFLDPKPLLIDGKDPVLGIDPGVLADDDGKAYVTWPFRMGQLDPDDFTRIIGETIVDVRQWMPEENTPFEGPSLRKRGDTYYYIYIENEGLRVKPDGTKHDKPTRMVYMTAKDPLGPYTYQGLIIANSDYPGVINIHGSLVEFKNRWYVFYHLPVPDKWLTRVMCAEPLSFDTNGKIIPTVPSSSGIQGAFHFGDRIQASGAVIFPGGDLNPEYVSRKKDYARLVFSKIGSYAGYRYFDPGNINNGRLTLNVKTTGGNSIVETRFNSFDGSVISEIELPDTNGQWKEVSAEIQNLQPGKRSFFIVLKDNPGETTVEIDWLEFNRQLPF